MSDTPKKRRHWARRVICLLFAGLILLVGISFYLSNYTLTREDITVTLDRLPAAFDGMTIALISDLHGKSWGENNHDLLRMVERAQADIIAVTGDMIDNPDDLDWAGALAQELAKLAPTYVVTGNHEWYLSSFKPFREKIRESGATFLDNDYVMLERGGDSIVLAGFGDPNGYGRGPMGALVQSVRDDQGDPFILAISHRNDRYDDYKALGLDLVLVGHGHGGMIRLPFTDGLISPRRELWPDHTNGVYLEEGVTMVVSRGMEGTKKGFRLFNRPHMILLTLRSEEASE